METGLCVHRRFAKFAGGHVVLGAMSSVKVCDTAHIFRDMIPEESVTRYCTSFLSSDFKFCRRSIKFQSMT